MDFLRRRQTKKMAREILRHAKHLRNMREDLMRPEQLEELDRAESDLRSVLGVGNTDAVQRASDALYSCIGSLTPSRRFPGLRENFEIVVVAIAVAMGFRTYFLQPFKIPTGSMQPTLYGIHSETPIKASVLDRLPLKLAKWLVCGQWYKEIRVEIPGIVDGPYDAGENNPAVCYYNVGGQRYALPRNARPNFLPGDYVRSGELLWSGITTAGDHVFVDKVVWNFRQPRRGEIMVFSTENIPTLPKGTHYIKRLVGMPGETLSINPPNLKVNGQILKAPESIARIARQEGNYPGYTLPTGPQALYLTSVLDKLTLGPDQYLALGDNTTNSKDGRYWGPVPRSNLVGPATLIYWPFSGRWGQTR